MHCTREVLGTIFMTLSTTYLVLHYIFLRYRMIIVNVLVTSSPDLKAAIGKQNQKFMACFKANDMKGVANLYTEDCKLMITGMDTQYGREATEKALAGVWTSGARSLEWKSEEIDLWAVTSFTSESPTLRELRTAVWLTSARVLGFG
ncbi:uncharacterized protein LOC118426823 [Branchiostoma floridae]|uniref:Uncharacterized protein LOC118426823 n=1 Tax=Branchiostoma floridae TaxID=7739 RepID=A0A9J7N792_BRAFL|nr:uncharacterized protein LOC118426823 [Branchiostoma floridae]